MDLNIIYPKLAEFQAKIAEQDAGIGGLFLICCVVMYYVVALRNRYPIPTRVGGAAAYLVAIGVAGGSVFLGALAFLIGVLWAWQKPLARVAPIWLIMLVGVLLRLPMMTESLWYDESFTAAVASAPDMMSIVRSDVHPPLWYGLEKIVIHVAGNSEIALRLPAFFFGLLAIWLTWRLAALHLTKNGALIAALLVAVSGAQLFYSNEARGYTLLVCAVLSMALAIQKDKSSWFAISAVVAYYTHNIGFVYVALLAVVALVKHRNFAWHCKIFAVAVIGALWLPTMLTQSADIADGFWMGDFNPIITPSPLLYMTLGGKIPEGLTLVVAASAYLMTIAAVCMHWRWLLQKSTAVITLVGFGVPTALALVSLGWHDVYLERAMLPAMTMILILWAKALTEGNQGDSRALALMIVPTLFITSASHLNPDFGKISSRDLLAAGCGSRPAYTTSVNVQFVADYYLEDPIHWEPASDLNQTLPLTAKHALGWHMADFFELPAGEYCLLDGWNGLARADERAYVQSILDAYPHSTLLLADSDTYTMYAHRITKP